MNGVEENVIHNQYRIEKNQQAITEIKEGCGRCIPQNVFRDIIEWYSHLTRRLIWVVCILAAVLFISNVIWGCGVERKGNQPQRNYDYH